MASQSWTSGNLTIQPGGTQTWTMPVALPSGFSTVTVTLNLAQADISSTATKLGLTFSWGPTPAGPFTVDAGFTFAGDPSYVAPGDDPAFAESLSGFVGKFGQAAIINNGPSAVTLTVTVQVS